MDAIQISNVTKRYRDTLALEGISFRFEAGRIYEMCIRDRLPVCSAFSFVSYFSPSTIDASNMSRNSDMVMRFKSILLVTSICGREK